MNHFVAIKALVSPSSSPTMHTGIDGGNGVELVSTNEGYSYSPHRAHPPMVSRSLKTRELLDNDFEPSPPPPNPFSQYNIVPSPQISSYLEPPLPAQIPTPFPDHTNSHIGLVVGVIVGVLFFFVLLVFVVVYLFCSKKRRRSTNTNTNKQLHVSAPPDELVFGAQAERAINNSSNSFCYPSKMELVPDKSMDISKMELVPDKSMDTPANTFGHSKFTESNGRSMNRSSLSSTNSGKPKIARSIDIFTFEEILEATNHFSKNNLLGHGGFGEVYKGVLSCEKQVAIKQLRAGSPQGEKEFKAEIEIISHIHHRNLVSLVGYCDQGTQMLLVYEFMANNSLAFHLHEPQAKTLAWNIRMQIAIGSAKGLAYLHEDCVPKIIHRDIKAANILLDSKYKAKISDFGLARFVAEFETHISTLAMGTPGYLAPECTSGKFTEKSDVYAFGVVLLEILSGRRASSNLTDWARPLLPNAMKSGNFDKLADPKLEKQYDKVHMWRMVACAQACIHISPSHRPQMIEIALVLEGVKSPNDLKASQESLDDLEAPQESLTDCIKFLKKGRSKRNTVLCKPSL